MSQSRKKQESLPNSSSRFFLRAFSVAIAFFVVSAATAAEDIYAVQSRISTPNFQLFLQIDDNSTVGVSGSLFGPEGGVYAATFMNDVFCGVELSNGTPIDYLVTIPHTGALVAQGSRLTGTPIGFPTIEGLITSFASAQICQALGTMPVSFNLERAATFPSRTPPECPEAFTKS